MFTRKFLLLAVTLATVAARAQNIVGDWQGTLKVGSSELRLVLHIAKGDNGAFHATLDSIDQAANGIPVSSMSLKESQLDFAVDAVQGVYKGKVNREGTVIDGTWTQAQPLPAIFARDFELNLLRKNRTIYEKRMREFCSPEMPKRSRLLN